MHFTEHVQPLSPGWDPLGTTGTLPGYEIKVATSSISLLTAPPVAPVVLREPGLTTTGKVPRCVSLQRRYFTKELAIQNKDNEVSNLSIWCSILRQLDWTQHSSIPSRYHAMNPGGMWECDWRAGIRVEGYPIKHGKSNSRIMQKIL